VKCPRRAWILLGILLAACTAGQSGTSRERASPPVRADASPAVLPRLILTADLTERPSGWHGVFAVPFGARREQLGFVPIGRHTPVPYVPMSFAVAGDGSVWFLDPVKRRLAHYSSDGDFLGEIGGIPFDRFHPSPRDIAMVGGVPVVLQFSLDDNRGFILEPEPESRSTSVTVHNASTPLLVSNLIQTTDPSSTTVIGQIDGAAFRFGEPVIPHPRGVADLGLSANGRVRFLTGMPLADGRFARLRMADFVDLEATFVTASGASTVLPIRFRLTARHRRISPVVSAEFQTVLQHGVACLIQIAPNSSRNSLRYGGGRWVLELSDDGSPLVWERIRKPKLDDGGVVRHLAPGPDGSVYLMQVNRSGVTISRR
jgi:hypothetical protein